MKDTKTHFGFKDVDWDAKQGMVNSVFDSVAKKYDIMNDVMSLGMHRIWKHVAISHSGVRPGDTVLDVASGTGDLAKQFARIVGSKGHVILSDINGNMLSEGRKRLDQSGVVGNVSYFLANAEAIGLPDNSVDCITISFGLRNVRDKDKALTEFYRVLKPGGRLLVLEFSKPTSTGFAKLYDWYSFNVIPRMGQLITQDRESYQYLAESIRKHPDQQTMADMFSNAGFNDVSFHNLTGGIVALHKGVK